MDSPLPCIPATIGLAARSAGFGYCRLLPPSCRLHFCERATRFEEERKCYDPDHQRHRVLETPRFVRRSTSDSRVYLLSMSVPFFRIKQHLEPLAVAANITQSTFCRIDEVLLTFGALTMEYKDLRDNRDGDEVACNAILNSLERRWANTDQDVFVAAVILNPFFKHTPFKPLPRFQPANIYNLFVVLWNRFFPGQPAPVTLYGNVLDYLRERGDFVTLNASVVACLDMSNQKVIHFIAVNCRH